MPAGGIKPLHRQAATIAHAVIEEQGSVRKLCLAKTVEKKKSTYALVCGVVKYQNVLDRLIKSAGILTDTPSLWPSMVRVLVYELLFGEGLKGAQGLSCFIKNKYGPQLKTSLKEHMAARRVKKQQDLVPQAAVLPRYVRVNTSKMTVERAVEILVNGGFTFLTDADVTIFDRWTPPAKRPRSGKGVKKKPEEEGVEEEDEGQQESEEIEKKKAPVVKREDMGPFFIDRHLPHLLVLPPKTDLHAHRCVRDGSFVLQDKASCLPPYILLHSVPMKSALRDGPGNIHLHHFIDACAAPGNKTSLLADLTPSGSILALERDAERIKLLERRMTELGVSGVTCVATSFLDVKPEDHPKVEGILVDPSCTGSGMVARVEASKEEGQEEGRLEKLQAVQIQLLKHALSFPNVRRVVYSTCSVKREENEDVISSVLQDKTIQENRFQLASIMPDTWTTRALPVFENAQHCIRSTPEKDKTQGFFVACLERPPRPLKRQNSKRRKRGREEAEEGDKQEERAPKRPRVEGGVNVASFMQKWEKVQKKKKAQESEKEASGAAGGGFTALVKATYGKTPEEMKKAKKQRQEAARVEQEKRKNNKKRAASGNRKGTHRSEHRHSLKMKRGKAKAKK